MHSIKLFSKVCSTIGFTEKTQMVQNSFYALQHNVQTRNFFGIALHGRKKEYHERKLVGYSSEQMFDVVSDVRNYKYFVPFCKKSFIITERHDFLEAALVIGFPPVVESYTSRVVLVKPYLVKAVCKDGKLFNHLITTWKFSPGLRSNPYSCIIDFSIDFEFKSLVHSNLAYMFFDKVVKQMENAFLVEARRRYGRETVPSHPLAVTRS